MKKLIISILFSVFCLGFALASINVTNYSIQEEYFYGDTISGWINASFKNQPTDKYFEDSEGNKVLLSQILNSTDYDYNCSSPDCASIYEGYTPEISKTFLLNKNESKILGFKLIGNIEKINSVQLKVKSNATSSPVNQLKLDFFQDKEFDVGNSIVFGSSDGVINASCYSEINSELAQITSTPYCQAINLTEAPGFFVGAWVKKDVAGTSNITMQVFNKDASLISNCKITNNQISVSGGWVDCSIDFLVKTEDLYYICLSKEDDFQTSLQTKVSETQKCGFKGFPPRDFVGSYYIGAKSKSFGPVGTINVNNNLPQSEYLSVLFENYIEEEYDSLDCSKGCIIPLEIFSFVNSQLITVDSIQINYDTISSSGKLENNIYDLTKEAPKINSNFQKLYINNVFFVENDSKKRDYFLKFDGKKIIEEVEIFSKNETFSLSPIKTVANYPTVFKIFSPQEFREYFWDFGENQTQTTFVNSTTFSYEEIGNYTLIVIAKKESGQEMKRSFNIEVSSPKDLINSMLTSAKKSVTDLNSAISKLPQLDQNAIQEKVNLQELESILKSLETKYKISSSESEYKSILEEFLKLDVPMGIVQFNGSTVPFYVTEENLNLEEIKSFDFSKQNASNIEIQNGILYWSATNLDIQISSKELILVYPNEKEDLIKTEFIVSISPKDTSKEYTVFYDKDLLKPLNFQASGNLTENAYVKKQGKTTLQFLALEEFGLDNLPVSIIPPLSELILIEDLPEVVDKKKSVFTIISILGILLFAFLVYSILRRWYKTKYEKHLFSDRNNLYNVMVYVNNSKKQGLENSEIKENLSRAGWTKEQIRYIMRKFENKETGMPQLTLKKETKELAHVKMKTPSENQNHTKLNK